MVRVKNSFTKNGFAYIGVSLKQSGHIWSFSHYFNARSVKGETCHKLEFFFWLLGEIEDTWVAGVWVPIEARRPKVGGGGGACPMAGIIRAFLAICTTCSSQIPKIVAHSSVLHRRQSAFASNELDLMGRLCRALAKWEWQCLLPPLALPSFMSSGVDLGAWQPNSTLATVFRVLQLCKHF